MTVSKIFSVDLVNLALIKSRPPGLVVAADGRATSSGWTGPTLVGLIHAAPPADGIQEFEFVADSPRPGTIVLPVLTRIHAEAIRTPIDIANYWGAGQPLVGVRCIADENSKTALLAERKGMPTMRVVEAAELANYSAVPASGPGFAADIMPLFRSQDVAVMQAIGGFNLHDYDSVKAAAPKILARLSDGTMPCDGAWPKSDVGLFRSWIDTGMAA